MSAQIGLKAVSYTHLQGYFVWQAITAAIKTESYNILHTTLNCRVLKACLFW